MEQKNSTKEKIQGDIQQEDIYDKAYVEKLVRDDAISNEEAAFLEGYYSEL
ncbi:MAG: hypothetical protein ACOCQQ_03645 [Candidatus Nanoarchaeia archaeon]